MKYDNPSGTSEAVRERTCPRCRRFLVPSFFDNLSAEITDTRSALAWCCVNCGEWVDARIVANRNALCFNNGDRSRLVSVRERRWRGYRPGTSYAGRYIYRCSSQHQLVERASVSLPSRRRQRHTRR
jgi:hypothetical protein